MQPKEALNIVQQLLNSAIKAGLFQDVKSVLAVSQAVEVLANEIEKPS